MLQKGIKLEDGVAYGQGRILSSNRMNTQIEVTVKEGRNRLVRRMFDALKHPVSELHRVAHGPFRLGRLPLGQKSHLTQREYLALRQKTKHAIQG
jgi:pseudouridine synthase